MVFKRLSSPGFPGREDVLVGQLSQELAVWVLEEEIIEVFLKETYNLVLGVCKQDVTVVTSEFCFRTNLNLLEMCSLCRSSRVLKGSLLKNVYFYHLCFLVNSEGVDNISSYRVVLPLLFEEGRVMIIGDRMGNEKRNDWKILACNLFVERSQRITLLLKVKDLCSILMRMVSCLEKLFMHFSRANFHSDLSIWQRVRFCHGEGVTKECGIEVQENKVLNLILEEKGSCQCDVLCHERIVGLRRALCCKFSQWNHSCCGWCFKHSTRYGKIEVRVLLHSGPYASMLTGLMGFHKGDARTNGGTGVGYYVINPGVKADGDLNIKSGNWDYTSIVTWGRQGLLRLGKKSQEDIWFHRGWFGIVKLCFVMRSACSSWYQVRNAAGGMVCTAGSLVLRSFKAALEPNMLALLDGFRKEQRDVLVQELEDEWNNYSGIADAFLGACTVGMLTGMSILSNRCDFGFLKFKFRL